MELILLQNLDKVQPLKHDLKGIHVEVEFLLDQHQHQEVCLLGETREFGVLPMINFQGLKDLLNGDSSLIQHFGTILI